MVFFVWTLPAMSTVDCHSGLTMYSLFWTIGTLARHTHPGSPGLNGLAFGSTSASPRDLLAMPRASEISFSLAAISLSLLCRSSRVIDAKSASRLKIGRDHFEINFRATSRFSFVSFGWLQSCEISWIVGKILTCLIKRAIISYSFWCQNSK